MKAKTFAKRLMHEKRRVAVSADGITLKRGSVVWCIETHNAGKTWLVRKQTVAHTKRCGMVSFQEKPVCWSFCWPLAEMVGDHRIFAVEKNARAEARKRNK